MEWSPARIRMLREVGLCESQHDFAKTLGVAERTIGNAERGAHPPSLALRRALDRTLERASPAQRDRFLAAVSAQNTTTSPDTRSRSATAADYPARTLDRLRNVVLGPPAVMASRQSVPSGRPAGNETAGTLAAVVQVHRLYHLADYDAAAEFLPAVLTSPQSPAGTDCTHDQFLIGTLTSRHATAAAYLAAAKLATKLGDVILASVTADRAMTAAKETEHAALIGAATYQVACALLLTGELDAAEQIAATGTENIVVAPRLNCRPEEALSARGSLLLLLAIIAARRGGPHTAQKFLHDAGQLAEQLDCDGNWLWTAFGPTNVAIHQLSVHSWLGDAKKAIQIAEEINPDALPAVLRGRRSQVHLELSWAAAGQSDDAVSVLHLLEAERIAEQAVSRNKSARTLLGILLARERRSATPGLRGLASRAGIL